VQVWGKRRLRGFANTGVFSISTGERQISEEPSKFDPGTDDGLAETTIEFDARLNFSGLERGTDPYNRRGASHGISSS